MHDPAGVQHLNGDLNHGSPAGVQFLSMEVTHSPPGAPFSASEGLQLRHGRTNLHQLRRNFIKQFPATSQGKAHQVLEKIDHLADAIRLGFRRTVCR